MAEKGSLSWAAIAARHDRMIVAIAHQDAYWDTETHRLCWCDSGVAVEVTDFTLTGWSIKTPAPPICPCCGLPVAECAKKHECIWNGETPKPEPPYGTRKWAVSKLAASQRVAWLGKPDHESTLKCTEGLLAWKDDHVPGGRNFIASSRYASGWQLIKSKPETEDVPIKEFLEMEWACLADYHASELSLHAWRNLKRRIKCYLYPKDGEGYDELNAPVMWYGRSVNPDGSRIYLGNKPTGGEWDGDWTQATHVRLNKEDRQ